MSNMNETHIIEEILSNYNPIIECPEHVKKHKDIYDFTQWCSLLMSVLPFPIDLNCPVYITQYDKYKKRNIIVVKDTNTHVSNINIMEIIDKEDINLLENTRIINMSRMDWGKTIAISNQYIQRNILKHKLEPFGFRVYSTDDVDLPEINISNNSPGFDLLIVSPSGKNIRIQSKLRQVNGITDYSHQIHFETTRRNSKKNENKNHTGHVCYSLDEFDYVMISLVNDNVNRNKIKNCNLWSYAIIPIYKLEDKEHKCCIGHIPSNILKPHIINVNEDIQYIFNDSHNITL